MTTPFARIPNSRLVRALPWMWLVISAAWAAVIFITELAAWPLALWIAGTVVPLIALDLRLRAERRGDGRR